ncbi:hypothetical protein QV05_10580 [Gallibacterium genomosp. 1]|uniref:Hemophilus-specific protein n=2 Tax=Gallibacterium genomosp. 1 TaxID=155515 RepID=A0AB36DTZ2_9PAST|nr:hypothetical protein QV04_09675 [Gallibacterium genomosp. 1]OBW98697.1 hypothetical protein QV05_10580 [Gallibacterium genomosp. 1]
MFQEFIKLQQQELILKKEELSVRREEIQANERLAKASIEAKQQTDLKHGDIFTLLQKGKLWLTALIALFVLIIVIYAMYSNNTGFALEILKIGGALLAGYFAGFGRGKAVVLERQQKENQDD